MIDLDKLRIDLVDSKGMERHGKASASKKSNNHHSTQRGDRGPTPEEYIAVKKREAVEAVMTVFNKWLDKRLSVISYAYESSGGTEGSSGGSTGWTSEGDKSGNSFGGGRPKRQLSNDNFQDGSGAGRDGDGNDQDQKGNKRARKDAEEKLLFACPFFQHSPASCTNRSCTGPGWASIHRLK